MIDYLRKLNCYYLLQWNVIFDPAHQWQIGPGAYFKNTLSVREITKSSSTFSAKTLVAIYDFVNCMIQSKWNQIIQESTIIIWYI